jgi:hypothetical protein
LYSQDKKKTFSESSSRVRFVANGGDPTAAQMVTEVGDRGSNLEGFVESFNKWLTTIKDKPQIAKFTLRPVFDVGFAVILRLLVHKLFLTSGIVPSLLPLHLIKLIPVELGEPYITIKRNLKFAYSLYSSNVLVAGSGKGKQNCRTGFQKIYLAVLTPTRIFGLDFDLPAGIETPVW